METIKERLEHLRVKLGYSQTNFAKFIEEDQSKISNYESGKHKPSIEFLEKIVLKIPNLNANWLLSGEGEMFEKGLPKEVITNPNAKGSNSDNNIINFLQQQLIEKDKIINHFMRNFNQNPTSQMIAR